MLSIQDFTEKYMHGIERVDGSKVRIKYANYFKENVQVGDGATVCLWTDRYACTVIKKTATTLTLRRDKAVLKDTFHPNWIGGGFGAHCTNAEEQEYDYEPDENGEIFVARWSEKKHGYYAEKCLHVIPNRHEFYDYNF